MRRVILRILVWCGAVVLLLLVVGVAVLAFPVLIGRQPTSNGPVPIRCANPPPHPVTTEREAVLAARAFLICVSPDYESYSEAAWLDNFAARKSIGIDEQFLWVHAKMREHSLTRFWNVAEPRDEDVWHVFDRSPLPKGYVGGGTFFEIAARDGRIIDWLRTQ